MRAMRIPSITLLAIALASESSAQELLYDIDGTGNADQFGRSVCGVGDVDGDGYGDFAVGDDHDTTVGSFAGLVELRSGMDGSVIRTFLPPHENLHFGAVLAPAGDVDGDGNPDLLVGAVGHNTPGEAFVVSLIDGTVLRHMLGIDAGDLFGAAVSMVDDVDGDGVRDIAVGSPMDHLDGNTAGKARVFSGADASLIHTLKGNDSTSLFGSTVAGLGDVDGDGFGDLAVGAPSDDDSGDDAGSVHVISGATGALLYELEGEAPNDLLGSAICATGDVDGDGWPDLAIGARNAGLGGEVRIVSGPDGVLIRTLAADEVDIDHGYGIAAGGDLNGDGSPDLLAGAKSYDIEENDNRGAVYAWSMADGRLLYVFTGPDVGGFMGEILGIAPDVNADGFDDVLIGLPAHTTKGNVHVWGGGAWLCPPPVPYCLTAPNSAGSGALITSSGTTAIPAAEFTLEVQKLPPGKAGMFFFGLKPPGSLGLATFGNGWKCTEGPIRRFGVVTATASGTVSYPVDFTTWPGKTILPGEKTYFQYWYRDPDHVWPWFNASDALEITFCE